jgi:hypothetical protein
MKKLTLDDVAVESFTTQEQEPQRRGTVRAHDPSITACFTCLHTCDGPSVCDPC